MPDHPTYWSQVLDYLGLVAGMFDALGIGDVIDQATHQHPEMPHSTELRGRQRSLDCQRRLPRYFPCAPSSQLRNLSENNLNNIGNLKIYH
jgi:hypothetical protein